MNRTACSWVVSLDFQCSTPSEHVTTQEFVVWEQVRNATKEYSFNVLEQLNIKVPVLTGDIVKGTNYLQVHFNRGSEGHGNVCVSEKLCTFMSGWLKQGSNHCFLAGKEALLHSHTIRWDAVCTDSNQRCEDMQCSLCHAMHYRRNISVI